MTAARTAPAPYVSGLCAARRHDRCRGDYRTAVCSCSCHQEAQEPPPEVLGEIAAALTEIAIAAAVERHCPACSCG